MRLEDVKSDIFGMMVHWLYTQEIEEQEDMVQSASTTITGDAKPKSDRNAKYTDGVLPVKLWILAERFLMPALQNYIVSLLPKLAWWKEDDGVDDENGNRIKIFTLYTYESNTGPTILRRLAVEIVVSKVINAETFGKWFRDLPPELMADLMEAMAEELVTQRDWEGKLVDARKYFVGAPEDEKL
jgi:hypothetical protein